MRVQCGKIDRCGIVSEFIDYNEHKFKITRKSIYHDGKTWGNISHASFCYIVSGVYDEIVHYKEKYVQCTIWPCREEFHWRINFLQSLI